MPGPCARHAGPPDHEGLAAAHGGLSPLQQAFLEYDAYQCGYCTPGQLSSATGMLAEIAADWPSAVMVDSAAAPRLDSAEMREEV